MVKGRSDGEETKRRIVDKAKRLFVQKGYSAVTMNEVCEAAGVSKGSLYHHFPSKDELFLHLVEEETQQWMDEWDRKRTIYSAMQDQLYALAEHYANDFQNPLAKALEEFSRSRIITEDVLQRLLHINATASQACRDLLREGMEKGEILKGDVDEMVIIVSSMLEGLGKIYYMVDREKEQERVSRFYREAVRALLNGIRAK